MIVQNTSGLIKAFKSSFKKEFGINLDFRVYIYLPNELGLSPVFSELVGDQIIDYIPEFINKKFGLDISIPDLSDIDDMRIFSLKYYLNREFSKFLILMA